MKTFKISKRLTNEALTAIETLVNVYSDYVIDNQTINDIPCALEEYDFDLIKDNYIMTVRLHKLQSNNDLQLTMRREDKEKKIVRIFNNNEVIRVLTSILCHRKDIFSKK